MAGDAVGHLFGHGPIRRPVIAVAAIAVLAACGSSKTATPAAPTTGKPASTTTTTIDPDGPFAVGRRDVTFVDATRTTPANGIAPAKPNRTLETIIEYPASGPVATSEKAGAPAANARFPVALFVHGFGAHADNPYLHYWAAAGFIAVAIKFPLTNTDTPGGPNQADAVNEPSDVNFVLSRLAHLPASDADLQRIVDTSRVGVMGQSLGATIVFDLGYDDRYRDPSIKAVVPVSGGCAACPAGIEDPAGQYSFGSSVPVLFIHGTADPLAPIEHTAQEYAKSSAPKFFLSLVGAQHVQFGPPWDQVAAQATIDFFDRYLKNESDGLTRLRTDTDVAGKATLQAVT